MINLYEFLGIEPTSDIDVIEESIREAEANGADKKKLMLCRNYLLDDKRKKQYDKANGIKLQKKGRSHVKFIVIAAVIACFALGSYFIWSEFFSEPKILDEARTETTKTLIDPDSAQYQNLSVVKVNIENNSTEFVCGEVNAKNKMGGYTGYGYFIYSDNTKSTLHMPTGSALNDRVDAEFFAKIWRSICINQDISEYQTELKRKEEIMNNAKSGYEEGQITFSSKSWITRDYVDESIDDYRRAAMMSQFIYQ